jgi:hypothetical protein
MHAKKRDDNFSELVQSVMLLLLGGHCRRILKLFKHFRILFFSSLEQCEEFCKEYKMEKKIMYLMYFFMHPCNFTETIDMNFV